MTPDDVRGELVAALADFLPRSADLTRITDLVDRIAGKRAAEELRAAADLIDRGPTFPLPPSIFSALVRERADDLDAEPVPDG